MNLSATHCFFIALTLLGCNSSDTPSDIIKEEPKLIVEDVKSTPCHEYFDSNSNLTHNALYFNYREGLQWLDDKQSVLTYLKSEVSDVKSDEYGLTAYIEGNSKWLKFEFSTGKFSKVRERHNNKSRQPPFAEYFVADLVNRLGQPDDVSFYNKKCELLWLHNGTKIQANWRLSEWYFEIYYQPTDDVPTLDEDMQRKIWDYYGSLESSLGLEGARLATAKHFDVLPADVLQALAKGIEKNWPISD